MEDLNLDNILTSDEFEDSLFGENDEETQDVLTSKEEPVQEDKDKNKIETTEVDAETLFAEKPESVGSEDDSKDGENTSSDKDDSNSPNKNFYSSIAAAFSEDGIFPDLDDETISKIKGPEDLADIVEKQIQSKFDERQRRIDEALNAGMEPDEIKSYENTISYLDDIKDDDITAENENSENLRKRLIYQDFINRGWSRERAQREVTKSFNAGTDIDDAKEALTSNKDFFKGQYNSLLDEARAVEQEEIQRTKEEAAKLKKSILEDKKVFGDVEIDATTRQKIFDNVSKPIYRDEDGNYLTAVQKYQLENKADFLKNLGIIYTLTDGFKNLEGLVKSKVNKEVKKGLRELEHTINNTARTSDGNLKFVGGNEDEQSFINSGFKLDV